MASNGNKCNCPRQPAGFLDDSRPFFEPRPVFSLSSATHFCVMKTPGRTAASIAAKKRAGTQVWRSCGREPTTADSGPIRDWISTGCLGLRTVAAIGGRGPVCHLTPGARVIASRRGSYSGAASAAVRARRVALFDVAGLPVRVAGLRILCCTATGTGATAPRILAASETAAHKARH